jgi:uncharacterized protein
MRILSIQKPDLMLLKDTYTIYKFKSSSKTPGWIENSEFYSVTKTKDELSIVCKQMEVKLPSGGLADTNWRMIKIIGPLDLSLTGIIAEISGVLAESGVPLFTISTYHTDYFMVKDENLDKAILALKENGYQIFI